MEFCNRIALFTKIASFRFHTCGLLANGEAWCWGSNAVKQLGQG